MALKAYGRSGIAEIVERDVELATLLCTKLGQTDGFQLSTPLLLNVVCFALDSADQSEQETYKRNQFLKLLDDAGIVRCTATTPEGKPGIRAALVNWMTEEVDIAKAVESKITCRQQL